jgi:hypothetical protein
LVSQEEAHGQGAARAWEVRLRLHRHRRLAPGSAVLGLREDQAAWGAGRAWAGLQVELG